MKRAAIKKTVAYLDALSGDQEEAHWEADALLLACVPPAVREAWKRAHERVGFWYA